MQTKTDTHPSTFTDVFSSPPKKQRPHSTNPAMSSGGKPHTAPATMNPSTNNGFQQQPRKSYSLKSAKIERSATARLQKHHDERLKEQKAALQAPALPPLHLSAGALARAKRGTTPSAISNGSITPRAVSKMVIPKGKEIVSNVWETRIKERTYDLNLVTKQMAVYEPLLDDYLTDYFQNPQTRRHLTNLGLIDSDGTIIDHKDFKYAQIKLQKLEYEKEVMKHQQERELDREIEIAIRSKAKTDKQKMQEKYQSMGDPKKGQTFPEFLNNYPVTMWRTVLLYAERPPSLTHVGISRRPKTAKRSLSNSAAKGPLSESEKVHHMFTNARKQFDLGDLESVNSILCEIIALIRKSPNNSVLDTNEGKEDHFSISQAIQDAIDKAGISLTGSERLLIGYIQKLGGNVEVVIQCLREGRVQSELQPQKTPSMPKLNSASHSSSHSVHATSPPTTARPQSARPTRTAQYPAATSFPNVIGSESAPTIPHFERPQSARKTRDAEFYAASDFSIGDNGSTVSVHMERPTSARPTRGAVEVLEPVLAMSEFSSEIGSEREEVDPDTIGIQAGEGCTSGGFKDSGPLLDVLDGDGDTGCEKLQEAIDTEHENTDLGQIDAIAAAGKAEQESNQISDEVGAADEPNLDYEENFEPEDTLLQQTSASGQPEEGDENMKKEIGMQFEEVEAELQYEENFETDNGTQFDQLPQEHEEQKTEVSEVTEVEKQDVVDSRDQNDDLATEQVHDNTQQESNLQLEESRETPLQESLETQSAIKLGSAFLTQKDLDGFFENGSDSEESFLYNGIGGARSDSEIRSNSRIGSANDSMLSVCHNDLEKTFVASPLKNEDHESVEMKHSLTSVSDSLTRLAQEASRTGNLGGHKLTIIMS
ncbi:hypothetical protein BDR26DRAFT_13333 [Obelidium mucronatum]|nr:hypothetical protein BDR26DRAFT_13333 [Obelidium mucronatum]